MINKLCESFKVALRAVIVFFAVGAVVFYQRGLNWWNLCKAFRAVHAVCRYMPVNRPVFIKPVLRPHLCMFLFFFFVFAMYAEAAIDKPEKSPNGWNTEHKSNQESADKFRVGNQIPVFHNRHGLYPFLAGLGVGLVFSVILITLTLPPVGFKPETEKQVTP